VGNTSVLYIGAKTTIPEALAKRSDFKVYAMLPGVAPGRVMSADSPPASIEYLPYDSGSRVSLKAMRQVRQAIKAIQPSVIHAFYPRALAHTVTAVATLRKRPPIVAYRGITRVPKLRDPVEYFSHRSPLVKAHACESEAVRQALIAGGASPEQCIVTYNCLTRNDCPANDCPTENRQSILASLGIPPDAVVIGTVANMRRVKGIDLLLKAAIECNDLTNTYWLLIGTVLDQEIHQLAKHPSLQDRVRVLGFRSDAQELIRAADLFVLPSRREALAVALLEAMSAGLCPLVSDAGGMKEAVRHQQDGLVVPRENVAAIAGGIRQLVENPKQRCQYAESAKQRFADNFTSERIAKRFTELYHRVLQAA